MEQNMKIAMLGHKAFPSRSGGVEVVVSELSVRMAAKGHDVTSFVRHTDNSEGGDRFAGLKKYTCRGVKVVKASGIKMRGIEAMTSSVAAAFKAAFGKFDVVHFHAEGPCAMMWLPKLRGKRCIATIHGLDWQREKWAGGLGAKYIRMGEKQAVKHADEIIVLSRENQEYFLKTYGRKTRLIPNGISRPEVLEADVITRNFGLEKDGYFLYLGRIVPEKRADLLVEAFKGVDTDKKLVIAGASSDTEEYYAKVKELAAGDERIIFTGFVSGRPLEELYSNAYAFVLPSDLEGMPMSLLEAMSYGNCCITSDICECAEVMDGHGLTFPKGDVSALKKLLQKLADAPVSEIDFIRSTAADYICSRFDWDKITDETLELYRGLSE